MNSNSNTDLQSNGTRKPRSRRPRAALIAASLSAALCIGLGGNAVSAAELDNGGFQIRSVDADGFESVVGMKPKTGAQTPAPDPMPSVPPLWAPPAPQITSCDASSKSVYIMMRTYAIPGAHNLTLEREVFVAGSLVERTVKEKYSTGDTGTSTSFLEQDLKATKGYHYAGKTIRIAYRLVDSKGGTTPWAAAEATTTDAGATYSCSIS